MTASQISVEQIDIAIDVALTEDTARGDITSEALIPHDLMGKAELIAKNKGILAGIEVARRVFLRVDPLLAIDIYTEDGKPVNPGNIIGTIQGSVISILKAERVALNFLQRLSGIASATARYVAEVSGIPVKILDTRKTTPGLRVLEKYAVRMGGGCNHRFDLGDGVLIKDNHIAGLRAMGMTLKDIVMKARQNIPEGTAIEIEVTNTKEALEALKAGADIIMLDNMTPNEMRQVVNLISRQVKIEASGGVTLDNVHQIAMTGVDYISVGALTHSYVSLDIALEMETQTLKLL